MNKKVNILYLFFLMICFIAVTGCKSIIEEDISDKKVIINSPVSGSITSYNQLFWWEKLDGALNYQVQIASPSFANVQKLLLDTIIIGTKINFTLAAGNYEWHVRALNGSYQTPYNGSVFTISDLPLNSQKVILTSPAIEASVTSAHLTWDAIPIDGLTYKLIVSQSSSFTPVFKTASTLANSYDLTVSDETRYYWKVKAYSDTDSSLSSSVRSFIYDVTPPSKVVLTAPGNNATLVPTNGMLTWTDSNEPNMSYIVSITYGSDAVKTVTVTTNKCPYTAAINQIVKWSVKAVDAASNTGIASDQWTFTTGASTGRIGQ